MVIQLKPIHKSMSNNNAAGITIVASMMLVVGLILSVLFMLRGQPLRTYDERLGVVTDIVGCKTVALSKRCDVFVSSHPTSIKLLLSDWPDSELRVGDTIGYHYRMYTTGFRMYTVKNGYLNNESKKCYTWMQCHDQFDYRKKNKS